jgi:hypothetical protein
VVVLVLLASCGGGAPAPAQSESTPSAAGWTTYHSPKWGYSLAYPPGWFELPNNGAPDTETYFGNEPNIGSPLAMNKDGIFFDVSVATGSCRPAPSGTVDDTAQLHVDGQTVTRVSGLFGPAQSEAFWSSYAALAKGARCFGFDVIFGGKPARDKNVHLTDQMISSFRTS